MSCNLYFFSGIGDCKSFRERVAGVVLTKKGEVSLSQSAVLSATEWANILAGSTAQKGIYISFSRGYQNNTTEAEMTTSNLGFTEKTFDYPPAIKGFGEMSYCDYKSMFNLDGGLFDVFLVLQDGTFEGVRKADGNIKGRRAKVFISYNAPAADNMQESFPVDISFTDINEWKEASYNFKPSFSISDLEDMIPVGLSVKVTSNYATGGNVSVNVTKRCSNEPVSTLGAQTAWEVLAAYGDTQVTISTVNSTDAALGNYTLTIVSKGTADITQPVVIRGKVVDATLITHVTQPLTIYP